MYLLNLMDDRHNIDQSCMTWCRDMKELHCYVAPPAPFTKAGSTLQQRLEAGNDFGIQRIEVQTPHGQRIEMAEERVLVPELFFEQRHGWTTLPKLIVDCAEGCFHANSCKNRSFQSKETVQTLLQHIVLVGGAADFPGMRPRVEYEVRELLREKQDAGRAFFTSCEDVYVLNPPVGKNGPLTTPRFLPLFGGCVRASSSLNLDEPLPPMDVDEDESVLVGHPGMNPLLRFNIMRSIRAGATAFRTGGGGGYDDNLWDVFDFFEDEDEDEEPSSNEEPASSGDDAEDDLDSPEMAPAIETRRAVHMMSPPRGASNNDSRARSSGKGKGKRKGQGKSQRKGKAGENRSGKGKSNGKGLRHRVWRPVGQRD